MGNCNGTPEIDKSYEDNSTLKMDREFEKRRLKAAIKIIKECKIIRNLLK